MKRNPYRGSSFDDWLKEEGIYDEVKASVTERIKNFEKTGTWDNSGSYGPDELDGGDFDDLTDELGI